LRRGPASARVVLIDRPLQFGRGQAYATPNPGHLLNVPAGRMSAFRDRPHDFLDWIKAQSAETLEGVDPGEDSFVPRRLFGAYIRNLLNEELKRPDIGDRFDLLHGDVQSIEECGQSLVLDLGRDRALEADIVVLAIGNFPPAPIPIANMGFYDSPYYRADPWSPTGPSCDYARIDHPLVRSLLERGLVRPDALRLGLDVSTTCAMLDREGAISRRLFAIGPVTKGAFWEMTAVPDLRRQCEDLATQLTSVIPPASPGADAMLERR
jgi:uncharacterized NAD(P)/FAD-binding protein YdhS